MATQSVDWQKLKAKQFIIHPFMLSDVLKDDTLKTMEVLLDIPTGKLELIDILGKGKQERAPRPRAAFDLPPAPERRYRIQYRLKTAEGDWTRWMWFRRKPAKEFYKRRANAITALGLCEALDYGEYRVDWYWVDEWGNPQSNGRP
jgi:hypothetical protein